MSIKVLLADDHTIMRQGLKSLLKSEADIEVVAEAANGLEAIELARTFAPDVIVMDMTMPELNGIEATRLIMEENAAAKVVILSMVLDRDCISEALKAGATGYVLKDCASEELVLALRTAMTGFPYLCREVTSMVLEVLTREGCEPGDPRSPLTPHECKVVRLIADGKNSKEIAFLFDLSVKTVEGQRSKIMKKLDLYTVAELTRYAVREGLVQ